MVGHKISHHIQKAMPTLSTTDSGVNITPVSNTFDVAPPVAFETDGFAVAPPPISAHHTPTNATSRATFVPGPNLSFDEGGVSSRSRMNPVRQYNKDKPNKFCVDFFVLHEQTTKY